MPNKMKFGQWKTLVQLNLEGRILTYEAFLHACKWVATVFIAFISSVPAAVWTLGVFTLIDLFMGIAEHFVRKDICSIEARSGAIKKIMLLTVAYAIYVAEVQIGIMIGVSKIVCGYFTVLEFISIVEHYANVGGKIPESLVTAMVNVRRLVPRSVDGEEIRRRMAEADGITITETATITRKAGKVTGVEINKKMDDTSQTSMPKPLTAELPKPLAPDLLPIPKLAEVDSLQSKT